MGRLEGKIAVITGAGSGMGKAMAELFVAEGAKVVCADRSGKQAQVAVTRCAALDYAEMGIRVNAVCPGMTWTGMVPAQATHPTKPPGAATPYDVPMGRWGLPQDIARAALYLACEESDYVTGVAVPVDGGHVSGPAPREPGLFPSRV
jgi:NAD(P)-dependent dehydrogenase (short-subunit alcohol dehydrogenase family)